MNPAYISAVAALAGSIIGGLTSLVASWLTQRTQARAGELTRNRRRREKLYERFIDEASRLYIDALGRDEAQASEQVAELVKIYSVVSQMRFLSSRRVIQAAENIAREIVDTYAAPKKTFPELREMMHQNAIDPLREFSEACRDEFEALGSAFGWFLMIAMARPWIGLALGSGSARGWSHIGIIESLTWKACFSGSAKRTAIRAELSTTIIGH
jgi:hypothetical protein